MNIGNAIRLCRNKRGLSLDELATAIGISTSYLSLIEQGKREPKFGTVEQVATILRIPLSVLIFLGTNQEDSADVNIEYYDELSKIALDFVRNDN